MASATSRPRPTGILGYLLSGIRAACAGPGCGARWATMPVIIGAALIDVFSTLLAVNKLHFAIY